MTNAKRSYVELSDEKRAQIKRWQEQVKEELPDLIHRDQLRKNAAEEDTLSGALRRAIHSGDVPITEIARRCEIGFLELDEFLTGESTLPSSVLDRLVEILGCKLVSVEKVT
jgi:hypothetical protein